MADTGIVLSHLHAIAHPNRTQESIRVWEALEKQLASTKYALGDAPCAVDTVLIGGFRAHFLMDPDPRAGLSDMKNIIAWSDLGMYSPPSLFQRDSLARIVSCLEACMMAPLIPAYCVECGACVVHVGYWGAGHAVVYARTEP